MGFLRSLDVSKVTSMYAILIHSGLTCEEHAEIFGTPLTDSFIHLMVMTDDGILVRKENKYILLNAPESAVSEICKILPGVKSPTILPLVEKGWCSLHSVVREDDFWESIDRLKTAGAEGILVIPIEKMIK